MVSKVLENPDIYKIEVTLPDNPLRYLNSYVIPHHEHPLIIDTGFNRPECYEALISGLHELSIDIGKAHVFVTHVHGDHSGLAYKLHQMGAVIYMNPIDHDYFKETLEGHTWGYMGKWFSSEGFPDEVIEKQQNQNQARIYAAEALFPIIPVKDGEQLYLAGQSFQVIWTPGHTKGHTCLYLPSKKIMFLGDHVLFDITPNITVWKNMDDALGSYLKSLDKINEFKVDLALPAHRKNDIPMDERIKEIKIHHENRLNNLKTIVKSEPELTAYEIAMRLPWSMRGKSWEEFPPGQKWFAMGETLSHLEYLLKRNELECKKVGDKKFYV